MGRHAAEADAVAAAPRQVAWDVLADASRWDEWSIWSKTVLEREEVVVFEPGLRLAYRLLSGLPVRDYTGTITLSDHPAGCRISWRSEWQSRIPGLRRQMQKLLEDLCARGPRGRASRGGRGLTGRGTTAAPRDSPGAAGPSWSASAAA